MEAVLGLIGSIICIPEVFEVRLLDRLCVFHVYNDVQETPVSTHLR